MAEGIRVAEDLLASPLKVLWAAASSSLEDSERGRWLLDALEAREILLRSVDDRELGALAGTQEPQGILLVAETPAWTLEEVVAAPDPNVVLVLDAVQDPGNFGTLIRSAEALGASGAVALPGTVDPWNPKCVRAAAGASFRLPVVAMDWSEAAASLRNAGFTLLASAAGGEVVPAGLSRAALIVGNEGAGVSPRLLADVDHTVGIPLRGRADSLNVAAAAAILLYELTR